MDKPAQFQVQSSYASGRPGVQRTERWQTSDCWTVDTFQTSTQFLQVFLQTSLSMGQEGDQLVQGKSKLTPVLGGPHSTLSSLRKLSQTPWIWLHRYTVVRSGMPWAVQEVRFNHWEVPFGPEICEFRNWPNSMHMASHYWGGRGRHLAERRK